MTETEDSRISAGADQIVVCGTCGRSLDADYDTFFETDDGSLMCVDCWIGATPYAERIS